MFQDKKRYPTVELFLPRSWLDLEAEVKTLKEGSLVPVIPLQNLIDIAQEKVCCESPIIRLILFNLNHGHLFLPGPSRVRESFTGIYKNLTNNGQIL